MSPAGKTSGTAAAVGGPSVTVLVADDNLVAQRLCRRVLEKAGYKVLLASDGQEAVSLALAHSPDVILMDIAMPVMDGLEATRRIKQRRPGIAIAIVSVLATPSNRERFLAAGADEVMIKPFRLVDLTAVVAKLAATRASRLNDVSGARFQPSGTVERPGSAVSTQPDFSAASGAKRGLPPFRALAVQPRLIATLIIAVGLASIPVGWFANPISGGRLPTLVYLAIATQVVALRPILWKSGRQLLIDPILVATGLLFPGAGVGLVALLATFDGRVPPRSVRWWTFVYNHAILAAAYVFPSIAVAHIGPAVIRFDSWDDGWVIPVRSGAYAVAALGLNYASNAWVLARVQRRSFWTTLFDNVDFSVVLAMLTLGIAAGSILYLLLQFPVGYVIAPALFAFVLAVRGNLIDAQRQILLKDQTLELAIQALDARDRYTASHSIRVAELAGHLGEHLELGDREVELIRTAGSLHDLGLIGVRDDILNKAGQLNEEDWELIRRHPDIGADMIAQHPSLADVAPIVRHHHEHWDGSGYPSGLKGTVIPLGARIIAVAESFDAATSARFYRRSLKTPPEALEDISRLVNQWFDPDVVNALREIHGLEPLPR